MTTLAPDKLKSLLSYDPLTGLVSVKTPKGLERPLFPDEQGCVVIYNPVSRKIHKMKLDKLAYWLAFGKNPTKAQRVLHKNMQEHDNRIMNLALVSKTVYTQIKEAHRNMTSGLEITPHSEDQFTYIVSWYDQGRKVNKVIEDIVPARRLMLKLQLKYSKVLSKYCVFD